MATFLAVGFAWRFTSYVVDPISMLAEKAKLIGDGDFASNSFLPYLSNGDFAMAVVRWLVHEEHSTAVATRIPVPPMILLSGAQMKAIFLLVEVLLPLAVLGLGVMVWWRRR